MVYVTIEEGINDTLSWTDGPNTTTKQVSAG